MAPEMKFEKWQALGNDYLIFESGALPWDLTPDRIRRLCEPHTGIGADGILVLSREKPPPELRIFNPDGSEAELSGNGVRQAALYIGRDGWSGAVTSAEFSILTRAGEIKVTMTSRDTATLEMGRASVTSSDFPSGGPDGTGTVESGGREWRFQHISIGNPQCVIEAGEEVEDLDLPGLGPAIEHSELFPNRTNVSFIRIDGDAVRARIFERGVGETASSGTGASGAAVTAFLRGSASPITVQLDGGQLTVEVTDELDVKLTGTATCVYRGELSGDLAAELSALR
jgi:diaminopimelate epimerase